MNKASIYYMKVNAMVKVLKIFTYGSGADLTFSSSNVVCSMSTF